MNTWERYISHFVSFLKIEKGLSENSILAYERDVQKLKEYALPELKHPKDITREELINFINALVEVGLSARSQARIISGLKQFYNFLILEDEVTIDPSELLEMPRIGRKLPEVLSIEEIDNLIAAVDLSKFQLAHQ